MANSTLVQSKSRHMTGEMKGVREVKMAAMQHPVWRTDGIGSYRSAKGREEDKSRWWKCCFRSGGVTTSDQTEPSPSTQRKEGYRTNKDGGITTSGQTGSAVPDRGKGREHSGQKLLPA